MWLLLVVRRMIDKSNEVSRAVVIRVRYGKSNDQFLRMQPMTEQHERTYVLIAVALASTAFRAGGLDWAVEYFSRWRRVLSPCATGVHHYTGN